MKLVRSAIAVTASIALLTGCASTPKSSPSETPVAKVYETAPLTGIKFEQGTNPNLAGPSKDADFTPEFVANTVVPLVSNSKRIATMSAATSLIAISDGAERLYRLVAGLKG